MQPFALERPRDLNAALALRAQAGRNDAPIEYIAGGTDVVQLLQEDVRRPQRLVSLAGLLDSRIEAGAQGLRLGAAATMADVAAHPTVVEQFPVISEALLNSASPQVRNQATIGGNLLQRTRCPYFRDVGYSACNKRIPGSGCAAIGGENRWHAVLGTSDNCIAANASDLAVALVALDAVVEVRGPGGQRSVPLADFHRLPEATPHIETVLEPGEVIAAITVPADPAARRSHYLKVRDRASFEFAVVSAAVALEMDGDRIRQAHIALGGVGTKPWRVPRVEAALAGASLDPAALRRAAALAAQGAQGRGHNDFKIELVQRAIVRAVEIAGARRMTTAIGQPVSRVDGRAKVTGRATYSAEFNVPGQAHGVIVRSTAANGRIASIDAAAAERFPGVIAILTHRNAPRLAYREHKATPDPDVGERLHVLQDDRVNHQGQPIALVIAETLERATEAANMLRITYAPEPAITDIARVQPVLPTQQKTDQGETSPPEMRRGDPERDLASAEIKIDHTYVIPREHHNPIEMHATIAAWEGERLTLWDKTQWVHNTADEIAAVFGIPAENVRVISPFVGGAFGSGLRTWPHVTLAALGARVAQRPVKVMLSRREMYYSVGYRPHTVQRVALGASRDGELAAIVHEGWQETSTYEEYTEALLNASRFLYSSQSVYTRHRLAPMNVNTPTYMRAPGEVSGMYALESAMDELAVALKMDPVELRLRNETDQDQFLNLPFSSRSSRECYRAAAERFGWSRRNPEPRSMRDGRWLIGWGMAAATYPMYYAPASAMARLLPDGTAEVASASSDMGPGTWTSMTQVAAETLDLPIERVKFALGDTNLPRAPIHGGSMTMASVGSAVQAACRMAREEALARGGGVNDLAEAMRHIGQPVEAKADVKPGDETKRFSMHAFGAVFVEVAVDPDLGETRVRRIVGAYGAGRIVNPKTTRSQCIGGMIGGIGMALMEHTVVDARNGRIPNANLAEYPVPVHADAPPVMEVIFVEEHDPHVNPLGVKGVGEIAMVGVAPAITNAIYHATGRRIRDLPVTPDKLL